MDWLLVFDLASDGVALVFAMLAVLFGYRAATFTVSDDTLEADLIRQSDYAICAAVVSALAAASFGIALLSI
jgi:hypothetical protein